MSDHDMRLEDTCLALLHMEKDFGRAVSLLQRTFTNAKLPPKLEQDISEFLQVATKLVKAHD